MAWEMARVISWGRCAGKSLGKQLCHVSRKDRGGPEQFLKESAEFGYVQDV